MKTLLVALVVCVLSVAALAQAPMLVQFGTLSLDFPSTWQFQMSAQRVEGRGPDGERATFNYRVLRPDAPEEAVTRHWRQIRGFANDKMPELAARNGEVLRPLSETSLANGRVQFSVISQTTRAADEYYFLQYLVGSSRVMAYIVVEGRGSALEAATRFESILATRRWNE